MNSILKVSNVLRAVGNKPLNSSLFHSSAPLNGSQFYPINDDVFGLSEEQKQVNFLKIIIFKKKKNILNIFFVLS